MTDIKKVLIVGGGTSGWLTAAILGRKFQKVSGLNIEISLLESSNIPTIGVGEGTFPTMLDTLQYIGIEESEFLKSCQATFKQAIKFVDWEVSPKNGCSSYYYHLFNAPAVASGCDLTYEWLAYTGRKPSYAHSVSAQAYICDKNLSPKLRETGAYRWKAKYAYHLDAGKFVELLKKHAVEKLGVKHLIATVEQVDCDSQGDIVSVTCQQGECHEADLFVDCSGFAAILIGRSLKVPFVDKGDVLFVDNAVTIQVPRETEKEPIASHTVSTAHEAGWTWDIGLKNRRGIGYVYSSRYSSDERAEFVLREYVGSQAKGLEVRKIPMRVGYREKCWERNCVAIGFSGGFMEPLEATAIAMVETAALMLAGQFPENKTAMAAVATKYNQVFKTRWEKIVEFIKLHYCLSRRTDSQFWIDNTDPSSIPQGLRDKLSLWRYFPPTENDFASRFEMFSLASYQYILYGMNYETRLQSSIKAKIDNLRAEKAFAAISEQGNNALEELPSHRDLIDALYTQGY